jgi:hypothetical protein
LSFVHAHRFSSHVFKCCDHLTLNFIRSAGSCQFATTTSRSGMACELMVEVALIYFRRIYFNLHKFSSEAEKEQRTKVFQLSSDERRTVEEQLMNDVTCAWPNVFISITIRYLPFPKSIRQVTIPPHYCRISHLISASCAINFNFFPVASRSGYS